MSRIGDAANSVVKLVCLIIVERRQCDGEKLTFKLSAPKNISAAGPRTISEPR
jgi:hypothetical protein